MTFYSNITRKYKYWQTKMITVMSAAVVEHYDEHISISIQFIS